jgi:cysteine desulfurase
MIYLDYAASTPVLPEALEEFVKLSKLAWANPSSPHVWGRIAKNTLEQARRDILDTLNGQNFKLVFTSSATESNNLAVKSFSGWPDSTSPTILVSEIEHDSVLKQNGVQLVKVLPDGRLDLEDFRSKLTSQISLVSIQLANNEIGVVQDLASVAHLISLENKRRLAENPNSRPVLLHTDATQTPIFLKLDLVKLGVDLLTISASKIYAPKGSACLIYRRDLRLFPQMIGGNQESGLRSGTENVPGAAVMALNLKKFQEQVMENTRKTVQLRDFLIEQIQLHFPMAKLNGYWVKGDSQHRLSHNVHFSFPQFDQDTLLTFLDLRGFAVSAGSGCHSGANLKSHVTAALGVNPSWANLRVSLGLNSTQEELEKLLEVLRQAPKIL